MSARLVALAGPLKGAVFSINEDELTIGRESAAGVLIEDRSVSRRHSAIRRAGDEYQIVDLESRNGTFVNGVPVKERCLEEGDEIRVGNSLLRFTTAEDGLSTSTSVEIRDGAMASTMTLRREDLREARSARAAQDWNALVKISQAISSEHGLEALERRLLELILEVAPAEHGAIVLADEGTGEFSSVFGWDRQAGAGRPVRVNRTIVERVLGEGVAVLTLEAMAVPLEAGNRIYGAIYLETGDPQVRFGEDLLRFVAAAGSVAALALENARLLERLESENQRLRAEINIEHNMVGASPRMREVCEFIAKVAPTASTVLLCGESGTGKELVARAIHRNSPRAAKPFVAINCAAMPEALLESELFGHEKGAFTGAVALKRGKLEEAGGGTLLLDEVTELAPVLQAKLLRVLQEREFERVGGTRTIKADLRLVTATNQDIEDRVGRGDFRSDLYYRLNVVRLTMPPLRERREDIPLLVNYFLQKHSRDAKRRVTGVSDDAMACLRNYPWPGNVRELENLIERAVVLGSTDTVLAEDLPESVVEAGCEADSSGSQLYDATREAKKQAILKALAQAGGNYTEAARLLGIHPNNLHRLVRNLDLRGALKK